MTEINPQKPGRSPRKARCTLKSPGHSRSPVIPDIVDLHLQWVHGTVEELRIDMIDEVPGAQPLRFTPDLTRAHTTADPVGIPIELFHHSSVFIRNLIARGFTPIWFPDNLGLVIGHRAFLMSLTPVPECSSAVTTEQSDRPSVQELRNQMIELSIAAYDEAFSEWNRTGRVPASGGSARLLDDLTKAWERPGFERTERHIEFLDALLTHFRETV